MKSIENKETGILNGEANCLYSHLINMCVKQGKQGGFDYTDIENRLAIGKATNTHPPTIELEDAQFAYLKKMVTDMRWNVIDEDLINFKNNILAIK